ncbi:hypothetical protein E3N88_09746 [Mikania micrantha]|uniref:Uncharacterized protein n=1 Tax=Mikania micrantha TaxID=192012 RepID=A0A5N6PJX8_9ASTR|nr:hypothetical protein E3N88_09746 [Mikania micrantha]
MWAFACSDLASTLAMPKGQTNVLEELFLSVNYPEMQELGILGDKIRNPEILDEGLLIEVYISVIFNLASITVVVFLVFALILDIHYFDFYKRNHSYRKRAGARVPRSEPIVPNRGTLSSRSPLVRDPLVKLTWGTLGITPEMHDILYGWVLFQQFIETEELQLLDQANLQVQKVLSDNYKEGTTEQFDKNHLYPAAPPLTRYKETMFLDEEVDERF